MRVYFNAFLATLQTFRGEMRFWGNKNSTFKLNTAQSTFYSLSNPITAQCQISISLCSNLHTATMRIKPSTQTNGYY